jgi:hypothetical protein
MAIRMQQRRGTSEQWTSANPILSEGEVGFETDSNQFKVGDGVNQWADLAYFVNVDGLGSQLEDYVAVEEKGEPNGVATLDSSGQVPANQLGNATVDLSDYATETYVDTAVSDLVASAPAALDTLNELAAALGDDANFATTVTTALSNKQDKVTDVSDTEIGYLNGVTSAIQDQLDDKVNSINPSFTISGLSYGNPILLSSFYAAIETSFESDAPNFGIEFYNDGEFDALENQTIAFLNSTWDGQSVDGILFTAGQSYLTGEGGFYILPITTASEDAATVNAWLGVVGGGASSNVTNLAVATASAGNNSISSTEIGYLDGVTSSIQTQLNSKASESYVNDQLSNIDISEIQDNYIASLMGAI